MTRQRFPKMDPRGNFHVRVGVALASDTGPQLADDVRIWLFDRWLPENRIWVREWTGASTQIETLRFDETFISDPEIDFEDATLVIVLHGRDRRFWRDWLVSRLVPDLKAAFPQTGGVLFIENDPSA